MIVGLLLAACTPESPTEVLPGAGFVSATAGGLRELGACIAAVPGTPAAAAHAEWTALGCEGEAYAEGDTAAACAAAPSAVSAWRGEAAVAFGVPLGEAGLAAGTVALGERPRLSAWVPVSPEPGPLAILVPGGDPAGPALLGTTGAVAWARVRPAGGMDIASLVPAGSQADATFDLKSAMLSRAVLEGSWELAVFAPEPGGFVPLPVLALGVRPEAAGPALAAFADGMRERWHVQRQARTVGGQPAECLAGLRVMPGLEPCYALVDRGLYVGWSERALAAALEGQRAEVAEAGAVAFVDFDEMKRADAVFAAGRPPETVYPPVEWPLGRVTVTAVPEAGGVRVEAVAARGCP